MSDLKPPNYVSRPALWTGLIAAIVLMIAAMVGWWAIGAQIRARVTIFQGMTLLAIIAILMASMLAIGYSRMWAVGDTIIVRNAFFSSTYSLDEIVGVRLRAGDPWAYLLVATDDPEQPKKVPVLAIQSLERSTATTKVLRLRQWVDVMGNKSAT